MPEKEIFDFPSFVWNSQHPEDCPFPPSTLFKDIRFLGRAVHYNMGDTLYPSWAENGNLYSPWTDGILDGMHCSSDCTNEHGPHTGQVEIIGNNPLDLTFVNLGLSLGSPLPYTGRYPCGSLLHNGYWYYSTYCLGPSGKHTHEGFDYNWPILGPVPGFRISSDHGRSWQESPLSPEAPLFPEPEYFQGTVKIGSPHFVDFGRNMEHSPDGYAYLVAHGTDGLSPTPRYANASWITGDQVYILRVKPSPETINKRSSYEFYAGTDARGNPHWSKNFRDIRPLLEWRNRMGCVTVTYVAPLKRYIMCVTDGWPTRGKMRSYLLESESLTGTWKRIVYMNDFGEQGYFLNIPSKFISSDGMRFWLGYSGNYWKGDDIRENPTGSRYGWVLQEVELMR